MAPHSTSQKANIEEFVTVLLSQRLDIDGGVYQDTSEVGITYRDLQVRNLQDATTDTILQTPFQALAKVVMMHEPLTDVIRRILDSYNESYFQKHIPQLLSEFFEDLWHEAKCDVVASRMLRAWSRKGHAGLENMWFDLSHIIYKGMPSRGNCLHPQRDTDLRVMQQMWSIKVGRDGTYSERNKYGDFIKASRALMVLIDGLKSLHRPVVSLEGI